MPKPQVGVPHEARDGETRVALVPSEVKTLVRRGAAVFVQTGAGAAAYVRDDAFEAAGATIVADASELAARADVVLRVTPPTAAEVAGMREGTTLFATLWPMFDLPLVRALAARKITAFALDQVPRISRAQAMDVRSAMATVSGYKAVILAADNMVKFCPLLMTAAGTIPPARLLVLGAGVGGLVAIGTAKRLGVVVEAFDVRPAVREQVESLGAKFIDFTVDDGEDQSGYAKALDEDQAARQLALIHKHIKRADMVITTALIPGRPAPLLVTREMLRDMAAGSVVVDLAATQGGNCAASVADQRVEVEGVTILAPTNLPATLPVDASQMYSRIVTRLLEEALDGDGELAIDLSNDVLGGCCVTQAGEVVHAATRAAMDSEEAP